MRRFSQRFLGETEEVSELQRIVKDGKMLKRAYREYSASDNYFQGRLLDHHTGLETDAEKKRTEIGNITVSQLFKQAIN